MAAIGPAYHRASGFEINGSSERGREGTGGVEEVGLGLHEGMDENGMNSSVHDSRAGKQTGTWVGRDVDAR